MRSFPQEDQSHNAAAVRVDCCLIPRLRATIMWKALGLAAMIIVLAVFMPSVLNALVNFLLVFFDKATAMLNALPASPADMHVMTQ